VIMFKELNEFIENLGDRLSLKHKKFEQN